MHTEDLSCAQKFSHRADTGQRHGESESHADAVKQRRNHRIFVSIRFRTTEDNTVYHNQRNVNTERIIEEGNKALQKQFHHRHKRGNNNDKRRNPHLIRYDIPKQGNEDVTKRKHHHRRKAHTQAVDRRSCHCKRGTHTQHQDKGRILLYNTVYKTFLCTIHLHYLLPIPSGNSIIQR